jgi:hypothetical protein
MPKPRRKAPARKVTPPMRKALVQLHGDANHPVSTRMLQQLESHGLIVIEEHRKHEVADYNVFTYLIPKITDAGRKVLVKIDKAYAKPEPFAIHHCTVTGMISIAVVEPTVARRPTNDIKADLAYIAINGCFVNLDVTELDELIGYLTRARDNMKARS